MSTYEMEKVKVTSADLCVCGECCHTIPDIGVGRQRLWPIKCTEHFQPLVLPLWKPPGGFLLQVFVSNSGYSLTRVPSLAAQYLHLPPSFFLLSLLMIFVVMKSPRSPPHLLL